MKMKIIIEGGKTHNVGYRPFLMAKARRLGIPNYESDNVEEDEKQRVIVLVGGEEKQVKEFSEFIQRNYPKEAKVSKVWEAESPENVMPIDEYQKILDTEQHDTMVQAGLGMIKMQKKTLEKQDETIQGINNVTHGIKNLNNNVTGRFDNLDTKYGEMTETMRLINHNLENLTKVISSLVEKITG